MKILTDKEYRRRMREAELRTMRQMDSEREFGRLNDRIWQLEEQLRKLESRVGYLHDRIEPPTIQQ